MSFSPFDQFFTSDTYDTELLGLKICRGATEQTGVGRLICEIDGKQSLWAMTTGASDPYLLTNLQVGSMIPNHHHYRLEATNRDGFNIAVDRMRDLGGEHGTDPRVWNYQNAFSAPIRFSRNLTSAQSLGGQIICHMPELRGWSRFLVRPEQELHLETLTQVGKLILGTLRNDRVLVTFEPAEDKNVDIQCYLDAAVLGLGFVFGRLGKEIVRREFEANKTTDSIPISQRASLGTLFSPIGPMTQSLYFTCDNWMTLWSKAADYFSRPGNRFANHQLTALWNSVDSSFSVSALVACSVLAGFCNKLNNAIEITPALSESQLTMLKKLVSSPEFLEGNSDPEARTKILGRIKGSLISKNAGNVLSTWVSKGAFGLSPAVLESNKALRNKPAHGHFDLFDVSSDERSKLIAYRNTIYQAINSILLSCMDYDGPIFDWEQGEFRQFSSSLHY